MPPIDHLIELGLRAYRENAEKRSPTGPLHDRAMHAEIVSRREDGNPTHVVYCRKCRVWHPIHSDHHKHLEQAVADFHEKHLRCGYVELSSVPVWTAEGWKPNADVKQAFQSEQTFTVTNLHSKVSSATAGWTSASVDNTSNLYVDQTVNVLIAAVNTAPASDKAVYVFSYAGTNSTDLTPTGAATGGAPGTEGNLTFPSISTLTQVMPRLGVIPYPVQNAPIAGQFSVARVYRLLPAFWGVAILPFAGFTLAASGNSVKSRGLYHTVI